jgi:hypothetical protein
VDAFVGTADGAELTLEAEEDEIGAAGRVDVEDLDWEGVDEGVAETSEERVTKVGSSDATAVAVAEVVAAPVEAAGEAVDEVDSSCSWAAVELPPELPISGL